MMSWAIEVCVDWATVRTGESSQSVWARRAARSGKTLFTALEGGGLGSNRVHWSIEILIMGEGGSGRGCMAGVFTGLWTRGCGCGRGTEMRKMILKKIRPAVAKSLVSGSKVSISSVVLMQAHYSRSTIASNEKWRCVPAAHGPLIRIHNCILYIPNCRPQLQATESPSTDGHSDSTHRAHKDRGTDLDSDMPCRNIGSVMDGDDVPSNSWPIAGHLPHLSER